MLYNNHRKVKINHLYVCIVFKVTSNFFKIQIINWFLIMTNACKYVDKLDINLY